MNEAKEGTMEGLNHCAPEVGHLLLGYEGQSAKRELRGVNQGRELTLRAEEVGSQQSCINIDHIAQDGWGPLLVYADVGRAPRGPDCGTGQSFEVHGEFALGVFIDPRTLWWE